MSFLSDFGCSSDGCAWDPGIGKWVHAAGCDPDPPPTRRQIRQRLEQAPPGSYLAMMYGHALRKLREAEEPDGEGDAT